MGEVESSLQRQASKRHGGIGTVLMWKHYILALIILGSAGPALCETVMGAASGYPEGRPVLEELQVEATQPSETLPGGSGTDVSDEPEMSGREETTEESDDPAGGEPPEETFWERMDRYHDETYAFSHHQVERMNSWFVPRGEEPRDVPPSRLRVSLPGQVTLEPDHTITGKVPLEADIEMSLPDARRLKVYITTLDPTELAGTPLSERDTSLRVGVAREWHRYITASAGVKVRVPPVVFAWIAAGTVWEAGAWKYYPNQKISWEIKDGEGEITSFVADRWTNPWDIRLTSSLKWSRDKMDADDDAYNGEHGWQWDCGLIFGYARELLREPDVVRFMGGRDLARGAAVRLGLSGGPWSRDTVSVLLLHKGQLRARWLYYFVEPEVQWSREDDWVRTVILTCGIEAVFWGGEER